MNGTRSEYVSHVDNEGCQHEPIRLFSTVRENAGNRQWGMCIIDDAMEAEHDERAVAGQPGQESDCAFTSSESRVAEQQQQSRFYCHLRGKSRLK